MHFTQGIVYNFAVPRLRAIHRWFHKLVPTMLLALIATLYRIGQALKLLPPDEVWFPVLALVTWLIFLYWIFAGSRAVRLYGRAYKRWAKERRLVAYGLAISLGAVIGAASGAGWWRLFELQRVQMQRLRAGEAPSRKQESSQQVAHVESATKPNKVGSKAPASQPRPTQQAQSVIIQLPGGDYGNIVKRINDLSHDLRMYKEMRNGGLENLLAPTKTEEDRAKVREEWQRSFAEGYRRMYRKKVTDIRDECAALHVRSGSLDDLLDTESGVEEGRYVRQSGPDMPIENGGFVTGIISGLSELAQSLKRPSQ